MKRPPNSVLFVCTFNRLRSPMAAGLMRLTYGGSMRVESCGLEPEGEIDGFAAAVMAEIGVDLSAHRSQGLQSLVGAGFELMIALSDEAQDALAALPRSEGVAVEHWPTEDPATEDGSRERRLEAYRAVRHALERRLLDRFGPAPG